MSECEECGKETRFLACTPVGYVCKECLDRNDPTTMPECCKEIPADKLKLMQKLDDLEAALEAEQQAKLRVMSECADLLEELKKLKLSQANLDYSIYMQHHVSERRA